MSDIKKSLFNTLKSLSSIFLFMAACSQLPTAKKVVQRPNPYPRVESGIQRICSISQEQDGFEERYIFDCRNDYTKESRLPAGFGFRSKDGHPYTTGIRSPYRRGKIARSIDMISRNHALNETYLHAIDFAGGPDSHDIKSVIYLFPRIVIPKVTAIGNEIELRLPTGETVSFDAETGAITGGVLKEGPLDVRSDRRGRTEPNVHYVGDFISVRLNHAYEEPTIAAEVATITQSGNTCELPRGRLFHKNGKLISKSDEEFLALINRECAQTFDF